MHLLLLLLLLLELHLVCIITRMIASVRVLLSRCDLLFYELYSILLNCARAAGSQVRAINGV